MREIWRQVYRFEGWYSISNLGRVRRDKSGQGSRYKKILAGRMHGGYHRFTLTKNSKRTFTTIGAILLEAFRCPRPAGMQVLHRDDVKTNNCLSNLYWGTPAQNILDRRRNGIYSGFTDLTFAQRSKYSKQAHRTMKEKGILFGASVNRG